jgi:nitrite reductase/ring-hydroxylating ferredoxin subunit
MFAKLCEKSLLPVGELRAFKIKGFEILAVNLDGKVSCFDGRCSHAGAPLAEGTLDGEILTCPWHYSQFNITNGKVLKGPAYKSLNVFKVQERDGSIYIDLT